MGARDSEKYYWLRMYDDFFTSKRIKKLRKLGADFVIIYLKLQLLALKDGGRLKYDGLEDTFADELALDIEEDTDKITLTLSYLQSCGLLVPEDTNEFILPYVEVCTGSETKAAVRKRNYRNTLKDDGQVFAIEMGQTGDKWGTSGGQCPLEKEIEKEKEIEIETEKESREKINYQEIVDLYNDTCVSFPRVKSLSDARKKAIKARLNSYSLDDFKNLFAKAEASTFLKGGNDRNWSATFDWLIKDANMAKVLDGNYDNNSNQKQKKTRFHNFNERNYSDDDWDDIEKRMRERK
jgi:predicted phage replisome organizer